MTGAAPRQFRMRWWMWGVAAVLVVLSAAIAVRIHGFQQLHELQRQLREAGQPADAVAWAAQAPPVDTARQDELRRILQRPMPWIDEASRLWSCGDLREPRADPARPARVAALLRAGAGDANDLWALMDRGPVVVSAFGWLERDPAVLARLSATQASAIYCPSLLTCRAVTLWLALQASSTPDPAPALDRLASWRASMRRPAILIDSMITVAVDRIADEAHLWLAVRGRLPPVQLQRWLAEPSDQRQLCADGFVGERCLAWEPWSRMGVDEGVAALAWSVPSGWQAQALGLAAWPLLGHDCARGVAAVSDGERWLRGGGPTLPVVASPFGQLGPLARIALVNIASVADIGWNAAVQHRLTRATGALAASYRAGIGLPASLAPPGGALPSDPPLIYERLGASRFRIGIDPALAPAGAAASLSITSDTGRPACREPVRMQRHSIEIDLDAVLVPPPEKPTKAKPK